MTIMQRHQAPYGEQLKQWRNRRRLSQLDFALDAEISQKHLSFMETGRSVPSREMLMHLAECLQVPLRERNQMLLAAGYAPLNVARSLDDPSLKPARDAINQLLDGHRPYPALAVDRHWTMVAANAAVAPLLAAVADKSLLDGPVNVLRLTLHPGGLAPQIANLAEWRRHLLERLKHQIGVTADETLQALADELAAYPCPDEVGPAPTGTEVFVPMRLNTPAGTLSFFSATTVFGTPVDVTLSEIAIESFFPADDFTRAALQALSAS